MSGGGSAGGDDLRESLVRQTSGFGKAPQLKQLQRLGQPYFLPRGRRSGWHFLWLLAALAFCVIGAGLVLLTAVVHLMFALCPDVARHVFSGARGLVDGLWSGVHGPAIMALAFVGVLSFSFFRRELRGMWSQWFLLGFIVLVLFSVNAMNTGIGFVANYLTQAMVDQASDKYYRWLEIYASCFIVALPVLTMQYYVQAKLGILWRNWLTSNLVEGWTSHRAYYVLNANDENAAEEGVDNPDQRIAQDVDTFTSMTLNYLIGTIDSLTSFSMNILVLWNMNATITKVLVSWSIGMTAIILVLSKSLVRINYRQLKFEADFRYSLVHVRDNAEAIAFYGGEASERCVIRRRLDSVVGNYNTLIIWKVGISVVSKMYNYGNVFVPFVVMGPLVLSGELTFGDFNQAQLAFSMVADALAFIANSISDMTAWVAGIKRLEGFQTAVEQVEGTITGRTTREGAAVVVRNADLRAPGSGQLLIGGLNLSLSRGERLLVVGPSGCGKTSLLRMICGLWQPTEGALEQTPPAGQLFFVPQKPYMILGSLRELEGRKALTMTKTSSDFVDEQLSYPRGQDEEGAWPFSDDQLRQALRDACLGHFVERYPDLAIKQDWARLMSLGEQQRVSFARVLLNAPSFVVMDEATSGLDVATEGKLYDLLVQRGTALMSVGHRPALKEFHTSVLALEGAPTGRWKLLPAASYQLAAVAER